MRSAGYRLAIAMAVALWPTVCAPAGTVAAAAQPALPKAAMSYRALVPARLLDTRPGFTTIDGAGTPGQPLAAGGVVALSVLGRGGVPVSGVAAVVLNVTVTSPTQASYLTIWPSGAQRPTASNLNFVSGQTVPNLVVAKLGDVDHEVDIFNAFGNTDVIVDIAGYFPTTDAFVPVVPARLLETRPGLTTIDGQARPGRPVGRFETLDLPVLGRGGVPATGVDSVVLNVTATNPTADSFVTVWPTGAERPVASNLNVVAGATTPNLVLAKVGAAGSVSMFNLAGTTDLVADVEGYYPTGGSFVSLTPARVLESRPGLPVAAGGIARGAPLLSGDTLRLRVLGAGGVPESNVAAVVLNVTAIHPSGQSYITVWPTGMPQPNASNLNLTHAGQVVPNLVIAKVGANGSVSIFNQSGLVDLAVDVAGYFISEPGNVRDLVTSDRSTCALADIGEVSCWGETSQDPIGFYSTSTPRATPYPLGTFNDAVDVALGPADTCVLRSNGTVWCWGGNAFGQTGTGTLGSDNVWPPAQVEGLTDVVDIDMNGVYACALRSDGTVTCWGAGPLGPPQPSPVGIAGLTDIVQIAVGEGATCALHETGSVSCWGAFNEFGTLGDGTGIDSATPVTVAGLTDAASITSMTLRTCAIRTNGQAVCWGDSFVGHGSTGPSLVPVSVLDANTGQPANDILAIDGGFDYVCALRADAQVYCLGSSIMGQYGLSPSASVDTTTLTTPTGGLPSISSIAAGSGHICARSINSEVFCWGRNPSAQLGDGTTQDRPTPVKVLGI